VMCSALVLSRACTAVYLCWHSFVTFCDVTFSCSAVSVVYARSRSVVLSNTKAFTVMVIIGRGYCKPVQKKQLPFH